jgi:hypothetical protein
MQISKSSVVQGALVLVVLQVSLIFELFEKAKAQHWRHFWIDVACLYFLAAVTGFVVMDALNYHIQKRR